MSDKQDDEKQDKPKQPDLKPGHLMNVGGYEWYVEAYAPEEPDLTPMPEFVEGDDRNCILLDNNQDAVSRFEQSTHSVYGRDRIYLTDEIIEALRTGEKVYVHGDGESSTVILYRPPEPKE